MASPKPGLLSLPPELLLDIGDFLPPDAILSLKLTHSVVNNTLPSLPCLKNRKASQCARFAIDRLRILSTTTPAEQRCIICRKKYPLHMFVSSSSPACAPQLFVEGAPRPETVDIPPFFCAWHVGRLARVKRTDPNGRNEWVSDMKRMCMHQGCIEGWKDCDCDCDSCGYRMVRTYTRYLNNNIECRRFTFRRNTDEESADPQEKSKGRLYVKENCWHNDTSSESVIDFPVAYELESNIKLNTKRPASRHKPQRRTVSSFDLDKFFTAGEFLCSMPC
ncbi:hypothetical protein P280DRAFT_72179 [Massarina eburnea CBS 473.64]|uniref:F-box domain-containing protein n=1 Tax=Massarina eburnea CBS 473.64 TaxID=1395130 RepID=A0A6A6RVS4_9PLEO|nr:hypothetical protein P280DRAFT_72179 [Massarina eburnea CBS 473.64]